METRNIYEVIGEMRRGMRAIGCTREEIEEACVDVQGADDYEDALLRVKKYWK